MRKAGEVTVRKRPSGKWEYRFEIEPLDGKRRRKEKGGFLRQKEAKAAGKEARDNYIKYGDCKRYDDCSVSAFCDIWLAYVYQKKSIGTYKVHESMIKCHIKPELGDVAMKDLDFDLINSMYRKMRQQNLSKGTIELCSAVLSDICKHAVKPYGILSTNPVRDADIPENARPPKERDPYTVEQIGQIFELVPPGHDYHMAFYLTINCGLRIGEALALTWDRINFDAGTLTVDRTLVDTNLNGTSVRILKDPKSKRSFRTLRLSDRVLHELAEERTRQKERRTFYGGMYQDNYAITEIIEINGEKKEFQIVYSGVVPVGALQLNLVCCRHNGTYIVRKSLNKYTKTMSEQLGFKIDTHTGRHTHATLAIESGAKETAVAARLGQKDLKTTKKYIHTTDNMDKEALDCFEASLSGGCQTVPEEVKHG